MFVCMFVLGVLVVDARASSLHIPQHITLTTLRGLKIYLLFNRLVRRFVMSVNDGNVEVG